MFAEILHKSVQQRLVLPARLSLRNFSIYSLYCKESKPDSKKSLFAHAPGPLPLGDAKEQKRIMKMIKKANKENEPPEGLSPEELEKFYEPAEDENDSLRPFPNNKNPDTGEINGPRGPEPTRFGDWERKGRVSDF